MKKTARPSPCARFAPLLFAALLLLCGCAAKKELPQEPPVSGQTASEQSASQSGATPHGSPTLAAKSAGTAPAVENVGSAPAPQGSAPAAQAAAAKKTAGEAPRAASSSPLRRMLEKAGRDPDAVQPEAGFSLEVPERVGDGEAFFLAFGARDAEKLRVGWRGKKLDLTEKNPATGRFEILLPVALDEKSASLPLSLEVQWANGAREVFAADLPVERRKYRVQKLTVAPKFVDVPEEMKEKIKRDRAELRAAVSRFTPQRFWSLPLLRPVPGEVTSLYGSRRVFNGKPFNPHRGVDFDAKAGDPILAAEEGVVLLAAEHYYSGNITVLDHGLGVMSVYLHQSAFAVAVGQHVQRGEVIGYIGSTGRSTGPHLHLSLYVLGESVNAAPFLGNQ